MAWKVRTGLSTKKKKKDADHGGSNHKPDYVLTESLFTLRVAHKGKFRKAPRCKVMNYVKGTISFIDYVDMDCISILEIQEMLKEIGVKGKYRLYYTMSVCYDSSCLFALEDDRDVVGMASSVGKHRCMGLFVDHELKDTKDMLLEFTEEDEKKYLNYEKNNMVSGVDRAGEDKEGVFVEASGAANDDSARIENGGKSDDGAGIENSGDGDDGAGVENSGKGDDGEGGENGGKVDNGGEGCSYLCQTSKSNCVVSCGEDSDHSDFYIDSDGNYELDDDEDFEKNIDRHLEWVGLQSLKTAEFKLGGKKLKTAILKPGRRSKKKSIPHHVPKYKGKRVFDPKVDMEEVFFEPNLCFTSTEILKQAVKKHAVENCRDIKITMSGKNKFQAKCKAADCPWFIYASRVPSDNTIIVKTLGDDHDCPKKNRVWHANTTWLCEQIGDSVRNNPSWKVDEMRNELKKKYGLVFTNGQMYRLKHLALDTGGKGNEFGLVHRYSEEVLRSNPGSTVRVKPMVFGDEAYFERIYICFAALKSGMLQGCRRVILLDGCHLKTVYGGILLTAVRLDGNNGMYPFAYAVVEKERHDSWRWFLDLVCSDLGITKQESFKWTIMSDKQKGLIEAVKELMLDSEHRCCVYHLYSNFKLLFKGLTLKELLWRAAKCSRPVDFERIMKQIETIEPAAYKWLSERPPVHWSKAYFSCMNQTDLILNNLSKCLNCLLKDARKLPIIQLLEYIRIMSMNRIANRLSAMLKHKGEVCPRIEALLDVNRSWSMKCSAVWNGLNEFQVSGLRPEDTWAVNMVDMTCSCRRWQLTGIPCGHAISCIMEMKKNETDYVAECYKKETYVRVYSNIMHPIKSRDEWPQPKQPINQLKPPIVQKMPGRPKKHKRKLGPDEKKKKEPVLIGNKMSKHGMEMTCSTCHEKGHNKRSCKKPVKSEAPAKKKGKETTGKQQISKQPLKDPYVPEIGDFDMFEEFEDDRAFDDILEPIYENYEEPVERDPEKGKAQMIPKEKRIIDDCELIKRMNLSGAVCINDGSRRVSQRLAAQANEEPNVPRVNKPEKLPIKRKLDVETKSPAAKKQKAMTKVRDVWFASQPNPSKNELMEKQEQARIFTTTNLISKYSTFLKNPQQQVFDHGCIDLGKEFSYKLYKSLIGKT